VSIRRSLTAAFLHTFSAGLLVAAAALPAYAASNAPEKLPTTPLSLGIHVVHAEVAKTDASRQRGLMFRESMKPNEGMLFVFDAPDRQCFWMQNTLIPLSIAFIADDGTISNMADMQPHRTEPHCSRGAVRYALEMNQGWFAERGIKEGSTVNGLP